jgi:hypothetical protein
MKKIKTIISKNFLIALLMPSVVAAQSICGQSQNPSVVASPVVQDIDFLSDFDFGEDLLDLGTDPVICTPQLRMDSVETSESFVPQRIIRKKDNCPDNIDDQISRRKDRKKKKDGLNAEIKVVESLSQEKPKEDQIFFEEIEVYNPYVQNTADTKNVEVDSKNTLIFKDMAEKIVNEISQFLEKKLEDVYWFYDYSDEYPTLDQINENVEFNENIDSSLSPENHFENVECSAPDFETFIDECLKPVVREKNTDL